MNELYIEKILKEENNPAFFNEKSLIRLWSIVEKYMKEKSNKKKTSEALLWFKQNDNPLKSAVNDFWITKTSSYRNTFKTYCKILDFNFYDEKNIKKNICSIDVNNFNEIIDATYRARCKVDHGEWETNWNNDEKQQAYHNVIYSSAEFLHYWIGWAKVKDVFLNKMYRK